MSIEDELDIGETLQPIPNFIKYIAMGLVALILLVIIWLSTSSSDDSESKQAKALLDVESGIVVEPKEDIDTKTINKQNSSIVEDLPINPADAILNASKSNGLDMSGLPFVKQKEESQLKLINLEEQLNQLITDNNARQQRQDEKIEEIQSQLTSQLAKIDQLQANSKAVKAVAKYKTKRTKKYKKATPHFTLVSIDQWGDDSYAVIRLHDQLYELTIGQSVSNWRVESIHYDKQAAIFKNNRGSRRELFVNS